MSKKIKITNCKYELKYDYYVTEDGHVWSERSKRFISELPDRDGYMKVRLSSTDLPPGKQHAYSVHRLVLENFCPREDMAELQVNHISGDKTDNSVTNLEWTTCEENIHHAIQHDLRAKINGSAKLRPEQVKEIIQLLLSKQYTYKEIANMYGVNEETIGRIKRKKSWKELTENINFD